MPNLNVGLVAAVATFLSLNAFASQTALHTGNYTVLSASSRGLSATSLSTLQSHYDKLNSGTYGVVPMCGSGSDGYTLLMGSSAYSYCVLAKWYDDDNNTGIGGFCFSTEALCWKFSGMISSGVSGNTNSSATLKKGYFFSNTSYATYLNDTTTQSYYRRNVSIANDSFFTCLQNCANDTGWVSYTKSDGTPYEKWQKQYCPESTINASTCSPITTSSTAFSYRCPAKYYNELGKISWPSLDYISCKPCPSLPKRDGTTCAIGSGAGLSSITSCVLSGGCESYDDTGDFMFAGSCFYTN